jgi:integrase
MKHEIVVDIPVHSRLREWLDKNMNDSKYIFENTQKHKSTIMHSEDGFADILAKAKVVAKPGEHITFHSFRHTFRTSLAAAGVDSKVAQRLGGWTTDISEKVYNHDMTSLRRAIDSL